MSQGRAHTRTRKSHVKIQFDTLKNELLDLIEGEPKHANKSEIRRRVEEFGVKMGEYLVAAEDLRQYFEVYGEVDKMAQLQHEVEKTEHVYSQTEEAVQEFLAQVSMVTSKSLRQTPGHDSQTRPKSVPSQANDRVRQEIAQLTLDLEKTFNAVKEELKDLQLSEMERDEQQKAPDKVSTTDMKMRYNDNMRQHPPPMTSTPHSGARENPDWPSVSRLRPTVAPFQPSRDAHGNAAPVTPRDFPTYDQSLSMDSSKLLTRVPIPKFSGNKKSYEGWKAAFKSCVDQSACTPEYKLLRLHNSLEGEALTVIESLGYSAAAYKIAMERLEKKYGGKKRQIRLRMEELDSFKPVRGGNPGDLEKLSELLDVLVVNLTDAELFSELGCGSLYMTIQRKLNEALLAKYYRWIFENQIVESVEHLQKFIDQEAEFLTNAAETVKGTGATGRDITRGTANKKTFAAQAQSENENKARKGCPMCSGPHGLWACEDFKALDVSERWNAAKDEKVCFRCLSPSHHGDRCTRGRICGIDGCKYFHHRLLHEKRTNFQTPAENKVPTETAEGETQEKQGNETNTNVAITSTLTSEDSQNSRNSFITLRTVPVTIKNGDKSIKCNALLDDCSTTTYINEDIAAQLNLEGNPDSLQVQVLNGNTTLLQSAIVEFTIESLDGKISKNVFAHTTNRVTGDMQVMNWNLFKKKWSHLSKINFSTVGPRPIIDILIGADNVDLLLCEKEIVGNPGEPVARLTPLGWSCVGRVTEKVVHTTNFTYCLDSDVGSLLRKYWEIDDPVTEGSTPLVRPEEKAAQEKVKQTLSYNCDENVYTVGIPWKSDRPNLPDNQSMATKRLENTEKRLLRSPEVAKAYQNVIETYEKKEYIEKVKPEESQQCTGWYLPHFPVLRPDKVTTKTRIVFDASAKHEGISLNDEIHQGPKLQNDLVDVLTRFRKEKIALVCDISEMYLQIRILPEDQPYQRFLWRDLDTDKLPVTYQFKRVVFGINASPFIAQYIVQEHAKRNQDQFPRAAETILCSTYMDDSMDSVSTVEEAEHLYQDLSSLWGSAGMRTHKWVSNSRELLQEIPHGDCMTSVDLDKGPLPMTKTLGMLWEPQEDIFKYEATVPDVEFSITKRSFLQKIATLFDPLGFLQPFTVKSKILMQEMWAEGYDWDQTLGNDLARQAEDWFQELNFLSEVKVPRCLKSDGSTDLYLHVFCDASELAYGAVAYVASHCNDGTIKTSFAAAKSRVAPLKATSIPRLELMAAVIGVRLANKLSNSLKIDVNHQQFWSDSVDVLYWVRGRSRSFKPFVANRVAEIQESTEPSQWRHVPTVDNPADAVSRGVALSSLIRSEIWWKGPTFLSKGKEEWPKNKVEAHPKDPEIRNKWKSVPKPGMTTLITLTEEGSRLDPKRHSNWIKLVRTYAWIMRFLDNCKLPTDLRRKSALEPEEISDAETFFIKQAQSEVFNSEKRLLKQGKPIPPNSKLAALNPILDEDGVIRCDGRLEYAEYLPWETRYPIILPRHWVTTLIIKDTHEQSKHGGTNFVLSMMSTRFWILSAREAIREWERSCAVCRRQKVAPGSQIMAPLPELRTRFSLRAFDQSSVDFAGPFITRQGRGKSRLKRYLCLFTCLSTRAVHLEMAYSLSTDGFLNAFYRMVSRRGLPNDVLSDNGTNFVGGRNELKDLTAQLDQDKIKDSTANKGVKWHFNPPYAPHFSGVHEVMIKAAKSAQRYLEMQTSLMRSCTAQLSVQKV